MKLKLKLLILSLLLALSASAQVNWNNYGLRYKIVGSDTLWYFPSNTVPVNNLSFYSKAQALAVMADTASSPFRTKANSLTLAQAQAKYNLYVPLTRTLTAGVGISSIGDLSANRTIGADTAVLSTKANSNTLAQLQTRFDLKANVSGSNATAGSSWNINILGNSATATSATSLANTRTIWGQNFNGTANVTGALTGVTDITASGNILATQGNFTNGSRGLIIQPYTTATNNSGAVYPSTVTPAATNYTMIGNNSFTILNAPSTTVNLAVANSTKLSASSTGVSVTGTLSSSGTATVPTLNVTGLTASTAVVTDASKNLASSAVTSTELGYVSGVTSAIQTQLNAKGSGTVTSVSVTTANGVSGSVATSTTTPAITLSLGAITPTSVTASGDITTSSAMNANSISVVNTNSSAQTAIASTRVGGTDVLNNQINTSNGGFQYGVIGTSGQGLTGGTANSGYIASTGSGGKPLQFGTDGIVRYTIDGSGNHDFRTGNAIFGGSAQLTNISSGSAGTDSILVKKSSDNKIYKIPAGYYATASAITTGTWTPSSSTVTLTVNNTFYQKVGNMVTAYFDINFPASASTNQVIILGLPNSPYNLYPINVAFTDSGINIVGNTVSANSSIALVDIGYSDVTYAMMAGKRLAASVTYRIP